MTLAGVVTSVVAVVDVPAAAVIAVVGGRGVGVIDWLLLVLVACC